MKIQSQESKSSDIHGVICETTKLATSDFGTGGICDFESYWDVYGSFSFKQTHSSDEIKCSQLIQAGI